MRNFLLSVSCLLAACQVQAQKKPLDHSVYDSWQSITSPQISDRGNVLTYLISPQQGDTTLVIRQNRNGREIRIPRGCKARISADEHFVICTIKPLFSVIRQARIKKTKTEKMPKDSLAIINLTNGKIKKFRDIESFGFAKRGGSAVAFLSTDTTLIQKKFRNNKDVGKPLLIYHLQTGVIDTVRYVKSYTFNRSGDWLTYTLQPKKKKTLVGVYDVPARLQTVVSDTCVYHSLPKYNFSGNEMLFLASQDTASSGSKKSYLWRLKRGEQKAKLLMAPTDVRNMPSGWGLSENSSPYFSRDGKRIFAGISQYIAPNDTNIVSFESPSIDIWNYDAAELPPMQKANRSSIARRTCLGIYDETAHQLIPLTHSLLDKVYLVQEGNAPIAYSKDITRTIVSTQWDIQAPEDISLIDLRNGMRKLVASPACSQLTASPGGKFLAWFDLKARNWMLYSVATGQTRNITEKLRVNFWDEQADTPSFPEPYGMAGWTQNDKELLIYDRYDIWQISTNDGSAINLTGAEGRKTLRTFRYLNTKDSDDDQSIAPNERLLLSVFDTKTKMHGFASTSVTSRTAPAVAVLDGYSYSYPIKARIAETYVYTRGNFQKPMDVYLTDNRWHTQKQLSHINPQQKNYNWGTVEQIHWTAYDGTPQEGMLYKPEDFDAKKKYPVLIYFYERNSDNLYNYITPQPSWSIINITFYVSRGYLVFVPDITYKTGIPGECAFNSICSGAEALAANSWVDKDNMAIQGQSWGGYQVAYLVTRTRMFKAAGAGAPVANMTSAYGGIRWQTGMSRQFQYEQTQSRIGRNLWDSPETYIANSPLFKLPNVTTPVLIMHNDADGAVPWYQGIEMFMGLRRLGKPAWLLEYNDEAHNLRQRRNRKDLSIRLQQFFDYYLKGAPEPSWMKNQLSILRKGQEFGY